MKTVHYLQTSIVALACVIFGVVCYNEFVAPEDSATPPAYASLPPACKVSSIPASQPTAEKDELEAARSVDLQSVPQQPSEPLVKVVSGSLKKGESLDTSLKRLGLENKVRTTIIQSLSKHLDFRRLDIKDRYTLSLDGQGNLLRCQYEASPLEIYSVQLENSVVQTVREAIPLEKHTVRIGGGIDSSLFAAFEKQDETASLVYAFADIFASKIDFNTETQAGDTFQLVVDKYFKGDSFVGYGHPLFARYSMTSGKSFEAHRYTNSDGHSAYFDAEGKEVGTSFLRSPVPMARVTSRFTYRRKHPITGRIKPHLGVDLAAPVGTPILAASDGRVISIGRRGGNGRQIILAHNGGIQTYYGHLSRYKKGLHKGSHVDKKEVIGYVGSSGLSTGPHLDYRIKKNGTFRNPFSLEFAPRSELKGDDLISFQEHVNAQKQLLATETDKDGAVLKMSSIVLKPDQKLSLL